MTDAAPLPGTLQEPSFPEAMEMTADWLGLWEAEELSDEVLADRVGQLVASREGARGFFVVSLTGEAPLMDRLPEPLVAALRRAGEGVVDLTARNLAMSTAMALHHRRTGDLERETGSERVRRRSTELLRQLEPLRVKQRLEKLLAATGEGGGADPAVAEDRAFLDRWGYDAEQRRAIAEAIEAVAE
ncbi:MAG: hypothetical protein ER33_03520 [Cyanobium sp. CACIAM 14]|nr:MAG: hypothetical protein ER33_03520 [Cyanobium sp. CACIAM 14]